MSRWFVPERLVRAYKSQPEAVTLSRKKRGVPTEEKERDREREMEKRHTGRRRGREEREEGEKRFPQSVPPAPLYGVSTDPRDARRARKKERAARRAPVLGIPNSTKPSKNSRKVPFTRLGPGHIISTVSRYSGGPRPRVNGEFSDYSFFDPLLSLSLLVSPSISHSLISSLRSLFPRYLRSPQVPPQRPSLLVLFVRGQ